MYKNWVVIFILAIFSFSLKPGAKISINNVTMEQLRDYIIPLIDAKLNLTLLQNYTKKVGIFEFNFTNSSIHVDPINSKNVSIHYSNMSNKVDITALNMSANATINIAYSAGKLVQKIICKASLKEVKMDTIITNDINSTGSPRVKVSSKLVMEISKSELMFYGSITAKILEVLEPIIKVFLVESVDIAINRDIPSWVGDPINEILSSFQVDQPIYQKTLYANFELTSVPTYIDNYLSVPIAGYAYNVSHKFPPPFAPDDIINYIGISGYSIEYIFGKYLFNSILNISFIQNVFQTSYSAFIEPFQMQLACNITNSPHLVIQDQSLSSNFTFKCYVNATNNTETPISTLFNVSGTSNQELYQYVNKTVLLFGISSYSFSNITYEKPAEFDISWFDSNLEDIAYWPFSDINTMYLANGIALPTLNHTYISSSDSEVTKSVVAAYANIVFH